MINYQFNFTSILTIYSAITILALGFYVFFYNQKKIENQSFFIGTITAFLWLFGTAMVESSKNSELASLWYDRFSFLGVAFISSSVYFLSTTLTNQFKCHKRKIFFAFLISGVFYLLPYFIPTLSIQLTNWGYYPRYGTLAKIYILYFTLLMLYSFYLLFRSHKNIADKLKRKQIRIFALGLLIATMGSSDFILTLGYNVYPFGYIPMLIFSINTAYLIKNYGFLTLEPKMAFGNIFNSTSNLIIGIDEENRIDFVNNSIENMVGFKEGDLIKKPISFIFPEENKILDMKKKTLQGNTDIKREDTYLLSKSGKKIPTKFNISPIQKKELGDINLGYVIIAQDVTKHKKTEDALSKSERRLKTILKTAEEGFWLIDNEAVTLDLNPHMCKILDRKKGEIIGKKIYEFVDDKNASIFREQMRLRDQRKKGNYEITLLKPHGESVCCLFNATPLFDQKTKIGAFAMVTDITELKYMENKLKVNAGILEKKVKERTEELTAINKELKKANQVKSNFLTNVSHELRTPLTSIRSFSEILLNYEDEDKTTQEEFLKIINEESERLTRLINDILDISKIEAGKIEWKDEFLYIEEILSISINAVLPIAEKKSIPIKKEIAPHLPFIFVDKDRLIQVFENLLSNALKFTDNGEIKIGAKKVGNNLLCYVSDTGIGIELKDQKNVFNRFEQIEKKKLLGKTKGTGLGLAICKEIVERYKGKIWIESEAGQGSTFYFTLPVKLKKKKTKLEIEKIPSSLVKKVILVADDEPNIRRYLNFELSSAGFKVIEASNGTETIQMVKERNPDLLILDILMPVEDGYDVLKELKTNPRLSSIPIIVLSILEDKEKGLRLGADAYLNKPLEKEKLLTKISELLEKEENKILLVDDDIDFVKAARFFLEKKGYKVCSACNGEEGLEVCREEKPDLVILDILMPKKDGIETLKSLKNDPLIQKTPVIILTVNAIKNGETRCLSLGAERYLTKKERLDSLLIQIREVLEKQESRILSLTDKKGNKHTLRVGQEFKKIDGSSENKYWITRFGENSIYIRYQIYFMGNFREQEIFLDYQKFLDKFIPIREGEKDA